MSALATTALIVLIWTALFLWACIHELKVSGYWPELSWPHRVLYMARDVGDPQRYVHMFYGECRRPWCYCHELTAVEEAVTPSA